MKKVVIGIIIAILIVVGIICCMTLKSNKKNNSNNQSIGEVINTQEYYGKRGNITESERIKFLSKNDEYLIGMIGLPVSNELKSFSADDMIRFSLNIAVQRYSNMLTTRKAKNGKTAYLISEAVVNSISTEFFGISYLEFDRSKNEYYSTPNKAFLFSESIEKTLYYYPVTLDKKENGTTEIIADAIIVNDDDVELFEKAKYEGKYSKENIDNTIKFVFNDSGKLVSYQYQ
ncbi:MAG: hypothetical protein HFJ25_04095 [Clostridia bacterium]|nr:hypothetical protein [Clostridia bacterium]